MEKRGRHVYFEILLALRRGNPFAKEIDFIGKEWCKVKGWRLDHTGSYWDWVIWEGIKVGYICHYVCKFFDHPKTKNCALGGV